MIRSPGLNSPGDEGPRQRVLDEPLDRPLERPRPERRVGALADDERLRGRGVSSRVRSWSASRRARSARSRSTIALEVGVGQGVEDDDLVDPVEELRPELRAGAPR